MKFHIFGLPHTITNEEFCACAYTQKVRKFARMMGDRGHTVIHYGHPDSDVPGAEHVDTISRETFHRVYGEHDYRNKFFTFSMEDDAYKEFFAKTIAAVWAKKEKNDFLLPFWGWGHKPICDAHPDSWGTFTVEPGIGYSSGHFASYKIFESYSLYHAYCGLESSSQCKQNWYEVVIPNYFDLDEFEYSEEKEDYLLFLGRVYEGKGIHIAIQMAKETGIPLKVAGQNIPEFKDGFKDEIPDCVEFVGYAGIEERKRLMAKAKGFILASKYIEPFGGTMIEALLSGTPVISTDWGAMSENNLHGITGYRCRTFDHFIWAAKNIGNISSKACREWGENFSLENVAPMYEEFFSMVLDQKEPKAWYTLHPERENLDWLRKDMPFPLFSGASKPFSIEKISGYNWGQMINEESPMAERLAEWLSQFAHEEMTLCDLGSGPGHFAEAVESKTIIDADAYDIEFKSKDVLPLDLTKHSASNCGLPYDVALCLEVAEHIEERFAKTVVKNVVKSINPKTGMLIWSAARAGQGGVGHVNCKPPEYWLDLFNQEGMRLNLEMTADLIQFIKQGPHMGWFVRNVMVLEPCEKMPSPSKAVSLIPYAL